MFAVKVLTFTHLRKKNLEKFDFQNFFRYSPPWRFCAQICTIANVLIANIMFAVEVLTFTSLSPIYERKTWKNLNIEIQNFIDFRFSIFAPLAFLCSNLYYSERAHCEYHVRSGDLRKKNLERNTEFYFDFRFSIFAPLAFLCSNLYYSERAHCEYHVRSGGSHFHPSTKEKLGKI